MSAVVTVCPVYQLFSGLHGGDLSQRDTEIKNSSEAMVKNLNIH
jgi:hypothetical protein